MDFYSCDKQKVLDAVNGNDKGLSTTEATLRLEQNGKNELEAAKKKSIIVKFFAQFADVMILVLVAAAVISAVIALVNKEPGELIDSGVILLIVIVNAVIGLIQENKAENALEALKNMSKPNAKVLRDGVIKSIPASDIVVGDIVHLEAGDIVPADMRLLFSASLKIEEAALTGESVPSEKNAQSTVVQNAALGDRKNMAYSSGTVSYGRGFGVVVAVGMGTEVGKIATMLNESKQVASPLQKQLNKTAKLLSILVVGIALIIFAASALRQTPIMEAFMTAVAIAVAAIPEGLPAVVTIVLAIGVQKMSKRKAIVKNLPSVETLGCCEVICSDKTGTLTLNQMTVVEMYTYFGGNMSKDNFAKSTDVDLLVRTMSLCNDSKMDKEGKFLGDPTETALVNFACQNGYNYSKMIDEWKRVDEVPFDSARKLMTTVNSCAGQKVSYTKGAPDVLIDRCSYIYSDGKVLPLTQSDKEKILAANLSLAEKALRVLGVAVKFENLEHDTLEQDIIFVGLVGMIDPPRSEVKDAVRVCFMAGMRPIMITGDHLATASAIAKEIGILRKGDKVMLGAEIDRLSDEQFSQVIAQYSVFARVSPENKVRIVKAYQSQGNVVAMTGDGVNDAPSIKQADIGVGMGITGTEVSKGAADMVLVDDNFATIVSAVEEGRKIFSNITKAIQFLLSANIAEVLCLFIATIFLDVKFLTPIMILWVNLVTDSLPALSLGVEEVEKDIMNALPRKSNKSLFAGKTGKDILIQGVMQTALVMLSFCLGNYILATGDKHAEAMTMAFVSLCLIQLFHSYNLRSQDKSLFSTNIFSNKYLNLSFIAGVALILPTVLIGGLQDIFGTATLNGVEWLISIGVAVLIIPLVEIQKAIERAVENKKSRS